MATHVPAQVGAHGCMRCRASVEARSVPRWGQAPVGAQGCRRLQVCIRQRRGGAGRCAAAGCAALVCLRTCGLAGR